MKRFLFFVNLFVLLFISLFYTSSVEAQVTCSGGTYVCRWFNGFVNVPADCIPGLTCTGTAPVYDYSSALACTVTGPTGPQCADIQYNCGTFYGGELYSESCQYSDPGGGGPQPTTGGGGPGPTSPPADPCGGLPRSYCNGGNSPWYCCGSSLYCDPESPSSGSFICSSTPPTTACPGLPGDGTVNACRSSCLSGETVYGSPTNNACGAGQLCCNSAPSACPGLPPGGINTCRGSCIGNEVVYGSPSNNACGAGQLCCFSETTACPGVPSIGGTNACLNGSSCPSGTTPYGSLTNNACGSGRVCCHTAPTTTTACPNNPPEGGTNACLNGSSCPGGTTPYGSLTNNACGAGRVCCNTPVATSTPVPGCRSIGLSCGGSNGTCCSQYTCSNGTCIVPVTNTPQPTQPPSCGSGRISCTQDSNCPGTMTCNSGCCAQPPGPTDPPTTSCSLGFTACGSECCNNSTQVCLSSGVCSTPYTPPPENTVDGRVYVDTNKNGSYEGTEPLRSTTGPNTICGPSGSTNYCTREGYYQYSSSGLTLVYTDTQECRRCYIDQNGNGQLDQEYSVNGVPVSASGIGSGTTSTNGRYGSFTYFSTGTYTISVNSPVGYAVGGGSPKSVTATSLNNNYEIDFGYVAQKTPPTPCDETGLGDVNQDGFVTTADSNMVFLYATGQGTLTTTQRAKADTNGNGVVAYNDGTLIDEYIAGTITTFPGCVSIPTCASMTKNGRSGDGGVSAAGNITTGTTTRLYANIINDDGNHETSAWTSTCGTFPNTQWDFADFTAPSTPQPSCTISYSLNGANQPACTTAVSIVPPACTSPTVSLTARGDIYVDTAGNNCGSGATLYSDATAPILTLQRNGLPAGNPATYNTLGSSPRYTVTNTAFCNDGNPSRAVAISNLPAYYLVKATRVNGGTWNPLVGYTHTLAATSGITNLDWCVSTASSWYQTDSGDVRYSTLTNRVPAGQKASTNPTSPGVFFSSDDIINSLTFGLGTISDTGWKVSDEYQYNDDFRNGLGGMSYTFYKSQARRLERPIAFLSASGLATLGSRSTGIYEFVGDATINTTTIDAAPPGKHIILLVSGNATINGPITLPTGRGNLFVLAVKGNITINPTVGRVHTDTTSSLDGYYTAEGSIILPTGANCTAGTPDLRLNVSGALVANSLRPFATGGSGIIQNSRTLCGQNATHPALFVSSRPEFLTQLSDFYKTTYKTYREVSP